MGSRRRGLPRRAAAAHLGPGVAAVSQTYAKQGKQLRREAGGYAHAKQFKRLRRVLKRQRTILGVVMREVQRKCAAPEFTNENPLT
jgi:IS5 family transposase